MFRQIGKCHLTKPQTHAIGFDLHACTGIRYPSGPPENRDQNDPSKAPVRESWTKAFVVGLPSASLWSSFRCAAGLASTVFSWLRRYGDVVYVAI